MSIVERTDSHSHLRLVSNEPVVVLPSAGEPDAFGGRRGRCSTCSFWVRPCATCDETMRIEAISWLKGLADDYFGFNLGFSLLDLLASNQQMPEIRILWRDPLGVTRLYDEPNPNRAM